MGSRSRFADADIISNVPDLFFTPFPLEDITIVLTFMMQSGPQTLIFCFIDYFVIGTYKWLLLVLQTVYSSKFPKFKHQHYSGHSQKDEFLVRKNLV